MMEERLRILRESFDRTFALPPVAPAQGRESFLAIRVAGDPYVVRLRDLAGLERRTKIAPLPGVTPGFLGLAAIRGRLVPVYSLDALLGYGPARQEWRWLALCRADESAEPAGFAFEAIEGLIQASRSEIHAVSRDGVLQAHVPEVLRVASPEAPVYGVVSIKSICASLGAPRGAPFTGKE
ncbi:MAG TPA: chemotaxis protein CheW [Candidatus Polarisedimenticolia bacterium]|jgi:chemotaxis signal transduction protein